MATEKVALEVEVKGGGSIDKAKDSVVNFKKELAEAKKLALNGDGAAAKKVAELTDKMEDLNDSTKSLKGSGVEKLQASFGLLGEGFKTFDTDKISTGFKGIGSAMKAIPILLIIEGIRYLVENFDELSKGNGVLAKSLRAIGDVFGYIGDKITELTDFLGLSNSALDKQGDAIKTNADKAKEAIDSQSAAFDRQIAVAKAAGKSTIELEIAKQKAIIDSNLLIAKQIEAFVRAGGELDDEKKKLLTASLDAIKNAKVTEFTITENDNKLKQDQYTKHKDDLAKIAKEAQARDAEIQNAQIDKEEADAKKKIEKDKTEAEALAATRAKALEDLKALQLKADQEEVAAFIEKEKQKEDAEKARQDLSFDIAKKALEGEQALSDLFFTYKMSKVKKGSAEEEALARKQFNINKAFQIGLTGIQGIQNGITAYGAGLKAASESGIGAAFAPLVGAGFATVSGLATAAAIAKISATQFGGGASASGIGSSSTPSIGGGANTNVPSLTPPSNNNQQTVTTFTGNQNNNLANPIKTYVVETDLRKSTAAIDKISSQATYG